MCVKEEPVPAAELPEGLQEAFFPDGKTSDDFDVYIEDGLEEPVDPANAMYAVISKRVCKRAPSAEAAEPSGPAWFPVLCHPKSATLWREGRMVRVFKKGKLVLYFVLSSYGLGQHLAVMFHDVFVLGGFIDGRGQAQVQRTGRRRNRGLALI
eukprot:568853-Rhodomonas_salina.1